MFNVLCDLHHTDLYHSLHLIFEERLGFNLYRPIGLDWFHQGYWKIAAAYGNNIGTVKQYLGIDRHVWKQEKEPGFNYIEDEIYHTYDKGHEFYHNAITLAKFKEMKFDIIIASVPYHIEPYRKLIRQFQPKAKLIFQTGNPGWGFPTQNVMSSAPKTPIDRNKNIIFYHQELDKSFSYEPPTSHKTANSYIHNMKKRGILEEYSRLLPNWTFKSYGAGMGAALHGAKKVAEAMKKAGWTWHYKPRGDGFGHVIHSTYACGRPAIIVDSNPYRGQPAGALLEDLVTCIDLGKRSTQENLRILEKFSDPVRHQRMCERAYKRFRSIVNYDKEEQEIRRFIENLQ